jgi:hypothetical protein
MSDADADELTRSYRREAIEIIKALDEEGEHDSVDDAIEAELRARMKVASATKKKKAKAKSGKAEKAKAEKAKAEKAKSEKDEPEADEVETEKAEEKTE